MIPTQLKSRIAHTLTWPIGAEAITVGLGDAPHVETLKLWFKESPVWPAMAFQRLLRESLPYCVMSCEHNPDRGPLLLDREWSLTVCPVLRPARSTVNGLLREHGLPAVADWLRWSVADGWVGRHHRLALEWNPTLATLARRTFEAA